MTIASNNTHLVHLSGWKSGAQKIRCSKLIREYARIGLEEAKAAVDRCLENDGTTVFEIEQKEAANKFSESLNDIGFISHIETR